MKEATARNGVATEQDYDEIIMILKIIVKLGLMTAQQVRLLRSAILFAYEADKECDLMATIKEANTKYSLEANNFRNPEESIAKISVPHTHTWNVMVKGPWRTRT